MTRCADPPSTAPRRRRRPARSRRHAQSRAASITGSPKKSSSSRADFATAEPDPQLDRLFAGPVIAFDALLHRDRTRQRGRRGIEHHHDAVTHGLYLAPSRLRDRLSQEREMAPPEFVGSVRRKARCHRGRTDHVREQHRHILCRHRTPPTYRATHGKPPTGKTARAPANPERDSSQPRHPISGVGSSGSTNLPIFSVPERRLGGVLIAR